MIYLKSFQLPPNIWQDWYFSPPEVYRWHIIPPNIKAILNTLNERFPEGIPQANEMTGFTTWYPWQIFYQRGLEYVDFGDLTIFYGGNGSGKTTLLNVIAQKLRVHRSTLYNRSSFFDDYLLFCDYYLSGDAESRSAIQRGKIITSDDVFDNMLRTRDRNQDIDHERERLVYEYFNRPVRKKKDPTCSKYVRSRLQTNQQERSNGETAFHYFVETIQENALCLLDEPENSLSAKWQIELAQFLQGAIREFRCQLIIATHSPFILSIPGAKIYDLDATPIRASRWQDLENVRCYYKLFKRYEELFSE